MLIIALQRYTDSSKSSIQIPRATTVNSFTHRGWKKYFVTHDHAVFSPCVVFNNLFIFSPQNCELCVLLVSKEISVAYHQYLSAHDELELTLFTIFFPLLWLKTEDFITDVLYSIL